MAARNSFAVVPPAALSKYTAKTAKLDESNS